VPEEADLSPRARQTWRRLAADAEERMLKKLSQSLTEDIAPLLPAGVTFTDDDAIAAFGRVWGELVKRIPGEPWKSSQAVIEQPASIEMSHLHASGEKTRLTCHALADRINQLLAADSGCA
jgi:hypothetical protein